MSYSFEGLIVWQKSRELTKLAYQLTESFPVEEKYGLKSQLRRSAISVSSNIAEGSTRLSKKDKARFYGIAYGSLIELLNQLILSNDLNFIKPKELNNIRVLIEPISRMISGLYNDAKRKK